MTPVAPTIAALADSLSPDLRRAADEARVLGFDGLTLEPSRLDESARSGSGQREVARIVSSRGLRLVALSLELPPRTLLEPSQADRALAEVLQAIELGAGLRAGVVAVDIGAVPEALETTPVSVTPRPLETGLLILPSADDTARFGGEHARAPARRAGTPGDRRLAESFVDELARSVDRLGVPLAIGSSLASLGSVHDLLRGVSLPLVGLDLDPSAPAREGRSCDELLDAFLGHALHVRARDAVGGASGRFRDAVIGQGDVRWAEVLQALGETDRVPPLTIDPRGLPDPRPATIAGLRHLRTLLA